MNGLQYTCLIDVLVPSLSVLVRPNSVEMQSTNHPSAEQVNWFTFMERAIKFHDQALSKALITSPSLMKCAPKRLYSVKVNLDLPSVIGISPFCLRSPAAAGQAGKMRGTDMRGTD